MWRMQGSVEELKAAPGGEARGTPAELCGGGH